VPTLFRDSWQPPDWSGLGRVSLSDRPRLLSRLSALGDDVYEVCHRRGLPRWRTFERVQEAHWAVIQHYGLWPTPLIDLTTSLRVAASFALPSPPAAVQGQSPTHTPGETTGWLYVVGLPNRSGSITYSFDDQMLVADLASVCPPDARRPHLQDGLLVGRFPNDDLGSMKLNRTDLRRRILAEIRLVDGRDGAEFWSQDFPRVRERSLLPLPDDDPLLADFATDLEYSNKDGLLDWRKRRRT
jgi:hypothetical protein